MTRIQFPSFYASSNVILPNCQHFGITLTCALSQVVLLHMTFQRYLNGEIPEEEWRWGHASPDRFQHNGSGEIDLSASWARHMFPLTPPGAVRSKGDVRDLELV